MKIRTDFVTNSSSVSFTVFRMDLEFQNGRKKTWGPWCAYLLKCEGEDEVCGYTVNFEKMNGNLDLKELVHAESVEMFSEILYQSINGRIGDTYEDDDEYEDDDDDEYEDEENCQLFTLEKNGTIWDETKLGGVDQLASVTLSTYEGEGSDEYGFGKKITYDFKTGKCSLSEFGEWFDAEDGTSGDIYINTGGI